MSDFVNRSIDPKGHLHKVVPEIPSRRCFLSAWAVFFFFIYLLIRQRRPTAIIFDFELETLFPRFDHFLCRCCVHLLCACGARDLEIVAGLFYYAYI